MTKQWRPENWNNPWDKNHIVYFDEANAVAHLKNGIYITAPFRIEKEFAYEEGADAMYQLAYEKGRQDVRKELRTQGYLPDEEK